MKDLIKYRNWKVIDCITQAVALLVPTVWAIYHQEAFGLFYAYFTVGGIQIISTVVNAANLPQAYHNEKRKAYNKLLVIVLITTGISAVLLAVSLPIIMMVLFIMLFLGPVMAIWYASISYEELAILKNKILLTELKNSSYENATHI